MIEASHHFMAVFLESLVAERCDRPSKTAHLRIDPSGPQSDRLSRLAVALRVHHLLDDRLKKELSELCERNAILRTITLV